MSSQKVQIVAFILLMIFSGFSSFVEYRKEKKITGKLILFSALFLLATGFGIWAIAVSPKHLQTYCVEVSHRYNTRKIKDGERFKLNMRNTTGRLKYSKLVGGKS